MTEALIGRLAQIRSLRVISRTSAMSFKGTDKGLPPLPEIARQLNVEGVIEGSVQRENGRVKVMIQLIHGPTDSHLWVRNYEQALTDILKLQDEMAKRSRTRSASRLRRKIAPGCLRPVLSMTFHEKVHAIPTASATNCATRILVTRIEDWLAVASVHSEF